MKYKPLSVNTLPRVFVNILAQEDEGIVIFAEAMNECTEMKTWYSATRVLPVYTDGNREDAVSIGCTRRELSRFFRAVLKLSEVGQSFFVKDFDRLLNELSNQDFWGTEGQGGPRGDRRNADPYR